VKKVIISGERKAEVIDVPDPKPIQDWALVKVRAAPMCNEYKGFVVDGLNSLGMRRAKWWRHCAMRWRRRREKRCNTRRRVRPARRGVHLLRALPGLRYLHRLS
jgi:hypothetical protein